MLSRPLDASPTPLERRLAERDQADQDRDDCGNPRYRCPASGVSGSRMPALALTVWLC
jgi:hypothetical protein